MRISVIVPVYKVEAMLPDCLSSIEKQTVFGEMELILVDDGSPDKSGKICDSFARKHENVKVIHRENGGASEARNTGLDAAEGDYIGFVDSDDTLEPDYFEQLLSAADRTGCDMAFSAYRFITSEYEYFCMPQATVGKVLYGGSLVKEFLEPMLENGCQNGVVTKLFKRRIIENNALRFKSGLKIGEDKRFVLEYIQNAETAVFTGNAGYNYLMVLTSAVNCADCGTVECLLSSYDEEKRLFTSMGVGEETYINSAAKWIFINACTAVARDRASYSHGEFICRTNERLNDKQFFSLISASADYISQGCGRVRSLYLKGFLQKSCRILEQAVLLEKAIDKFSKIRSAVK